MKKTLEKKLAFKENGLIPVILQDHSNRNVLMAAYMNPEALERTLRTNEVHFFSRSRQTLWHKGLTSGNKMRLREVLVDCDRDALLLRVEPKGPACHTGSPSCFFTRWEKGRLKRIARPAGGASEILDRVYSVILDRKKNPQKGSYVSSLMRGGRDRILKKIGEEAGELIISSKNRKKAEIVWEVADLWFHTLVMMGAHGVTPREIYGELEGRFGKPGKIPKRGGKRGRKK
jgi:phosphoribosyl-AMP cyclohydrolase / phosphoribosyl-ATP pyrophosphohydrolase